MQSVLTEQASTACPRCRRVLGAQTEEVLPARSALNWGSGATPRGSEAAGRRLVPPLGACSGCRPRCSPHSREPQGPPIPSSSYPIGPPGCPVGRRPRAADHTLAYRAQFVPRAVCRSHWGPRPWTGEPELSCSRWAVKVQPEPASQRPRREWSQAALSPRTEGEVAP